MWNYSLLMGLQKYFERLISTIAHVLIILERDDSSENTYLDSSVRNPIVFVPYVIKWSGSVVWGVVKEFSGNFKCDKIYM